MQWATEEGILAILDAAGLRSHHRSVQARVYATAAAFAAGTEAIWLSLLRLPTLERHQVGDARLLVVTPTRVIEVTGQMNGDWWSQLRDSTTGRVSVSIRQLAIFSGLTFEAEGVQWRLGNGDPADDFTLGTSATLTGPVGVEPLVLWDGRDVSEYARATAAARLGLLRRLATGGHSVGGSEGAS